MLKRSDLQEPQALRLKGEVQRAQLISFKAGSWETLRRSSVGIIRRALTQSRK